MHLIIGLIYITNIDRVIIARLELVEDFFLTKNESSKVWNLDVGDWNGMDGFRLSAFLTALSRVLIIDC